LLLIAKNILIVKESNMIPITDKEKLNLKEGCPKHGKEFLYKDSNLSQTVYCYAETNDIISDHCWYHINKLGRPGNKVVTTYCKNHPDVLSEPHSSFCKECRRKNIRDAVRRFKAKQKRLRELRVNCE